MNAKHETPVSQPPEPSEAEIQRQAYHLWIEGGRLEGVELDNWLTAKELLRHHHGQVLHVHFPPSHAAQRPAGNLGKT